MLADEPAHLLLLPLPLKTLVPQTARLWLKQVRQESWCQPTVRFEAAQQARFIGSNTV